MHLFPAPFAEPATVAEPPFLIRAPRVRSACRAYNQLEARARTPQRTTAGWRPKAKLLGSCEINETEDRHGRRDADGRADRRRAFASGSPRRMEWQKTRFPGCEAKTLLFDRNTGLMTALMRFAPGAVLPDHEHVNIEQTYVLEGCSSTRKARRRASNARPANSSGASRAAAMSPGAPRVA